MNRASQHISQLQRVLGANCQRNHQRERPFGFAFIPLSLLQFALFSRTPGPGETLSLCQPSKKVKPPPRTIRQASVPDATPASKKYLLLLLCMRNYYARLKGLDCGLIILDQVWVAFKTPVNVAKMTTLGCRKHALEIRSIPLVFTSI
jgi:hypothetical protein